jgi:hypothetical protein
MLTFYETIIFYNFILSAYVEDHACVPKHLHKAFRQRQALRRAGTGFACG